MKRENSLISIIIPSFNRKELITKAIESVLKQSYKYIEIIIIDDGSTDGTYEYLKNKYEKNKSVYIYVNEKNMGAGSSRKIGYNKANGKYIVFMDDDDYYTNFDFFKKAIQILEEKPNIGMVCASSIIEYVNENKFEESILNIKGEIKKEEYLLEFQQKYMKSNSTFTTVFRKETLDKANFNDVKMVNDSSIYLRALLAGDAYILDLICGIYRVHSKNITFNLKTDFIIENLIEKRKIYEEIKKRKLLSNADEWLKKQIKLTAIYFVRNNKISNEDFEKLIYWCEDNCKNYIEELVNSLLVARREKNHMKKIFLMAYARKNLGDDLFIKMLLERYPMNDFYMKINNNEFLEKLGKYDNLHVLIGNDTDEELFKLDVNEYDAYIYIGGSIFMEGGKVYNLSEKFLDFVSRCKKNNKPFCYISCNYGPYQTQEYFKLSQKNFEECTDICFRDKYSYNLFKDIETVRYAPDYAFSYKIKENNKIPNSIGISVIDLGIRKDLREKQEKFITFLTNNIKEYIDMGKKVYLYSFCKHEGDEKTIDIILDKFHNNSNLVEVKYDGDIDGFMELYSKMEYMICVRFHAMVLSCVARQKMYIMSYSKKIDNVIEDLNLNLPIIHFSEIKEEIRLDLNNFLSVDEDKIKKIIKDSSKQIKGITKYIDNFLKY